MWKHSKATICEPWRSLRGNHWRQPGLWFVAPRTVRIDPCWLNSHYITLWNGCPSKARRKHQSFYPTSQTSGHTHLPDRHQAPSLLSFWNASVSNSSCHNACLFLAGETSGQFYLYPYTFLMFCKKHIKLTCIILTVKKKISTRLKKYDCTNSPEVKKYASSHSKTASREFH